MAMQRSLCCFLLAGLMVVGTSETRALAQAKFEVYVSGLVLDNSFAGKVKNLKRLISCSHYLEECPNKRN
jgi:hypothetical protein